RTTAACAHRQLAGGRRLGAGRERCDLFVTGVHPLDLAQALQAVGQPVQAVAADAPNLRDPGSSEGLGEVIGDGSAGHGANSLSSRMSARGRNRPCAWSQIDPLRLTQFSACGWAPFMSALDSVDSRLSGERVVTVPFPYLTDRVRQQAGSYRFVRHVLGQRQGRAPCVRPASKTCAMCEASVMGMRHVRGQRQGRAPCVRPASFGKRALGPFNLTPAAAPRFCSGRRSALSG
nr:hypothetical protein [Tanacetum cinerariifolium]